MRLIISIRDIGKNTPDYSVQVEAPAVPEIGSYISIHRPDKEAGHTEDMIVRYVWWRFEYPGTSAIDTDPPTVGSTAEIVVECDVAEGPQSTDTWRMLIKGGRSHGVEIPEFDVGRFSVTESELSKLNSRDS